MITLTIAFDETTGQLGITGPPEVINNDMLADWLFKKAARQIEQNCNKIAREKAEGKKIEIAPANMNFGMRH